MTILRLIIEVPGYYVGADDDAEDVEESMQLVTEQITVTFAHTEGDSPQVFLKPMEAHIVGYGVWRG